MPAPISEEVRGQIMAAFLADPTSGLRTIAAKYQISVSTAKGIKDEMQASLGKGSITPAQSDDLDGLIYKLLRARIETLCIQTEYFRTKAFLDRSSASELAILHGVTDDKTLRLLEAFSAAGRSEDAGGGSAGYDAGQTPAAANG